MIFDPTRAAEGIEPAFLERQRWYGGKGRAIFRIRIADALALPGLREGYLLILDVEYRDGGYEAYALPAWVSSSGRIWEPSPGEGFWIALVNAVEEGGRLPGMRGVFDLRPSAALDELSRGVYGERALGVDQSNTTTILGERLALKIYRRLVVGRHPEIEMGEALTERAAFPHVPRHAGSITYVDEQGRVTALAVLQEFIPDAEDGWEAVIGRLGHAIAAEPGSVDLAAATEEVVAPARAIAQLHVALERELGSRQATPADLLAWREEAELQLDRAIELVEDEAGTELRAFAPAIRAGLAAFEHVDPPLLTRVHGDLHYAQILRSPAGLHIVDFEGEPTRDLDDRRRLTSPLRDVACVIRSLDHIARTAERRAGSVARPGLQVDDWLTRATERFCAAYSAELALHETGIRFDPLLLQAFELEKETYEYLYAAQFLPSWMYAPQLGMRWLLRAA